MTSASLGALADLCPGEEEEEEWERRGRRGGTASSRQPYKQAGRCRRGINREIRYNMLQFQSGMNYQRGREAAGGGEKWLSHIHAGRMGSSGSRQAEKGIILNVGQHEAA